MVSCLIKSNQNTFINFLLFSNSSLAPMDPIGMLSPGLISPKKYKYLECWYLLNLKEKLFKIPSCRIPPKGPTASKVTVSGLDFEDKQ